MRIRSSFTLCSPLGLTGAAFIFAAVGCASAKSPQPVKPTASPVTPVNEPADPELPEQVQPVLLKNATVMTAAGDIIEGGYVYFADGLIRSVGEGEPTSIDDNTDIIDVQGGFITPGIIDTHSHMGVYPWPSVNAHADGNEMTSPTTPEVWAEHAFWPQDPALHRAVRNGITTIQVLPGSANLVGGRSFIAKLHPATSARAMRFPGAPQGVKMACGENPKRVYGSKGRSPMTRMGNAAGFRALFERALSFRRNQEKYARALEAWESGSKSEDPPSPPDRDLGLETVAGVLSGDLLLHVHCYRADDMHIMLDLAETYGFKIRSFHHTLEGYKLRDRLAETETASSTWADWWGFKMEAYDGIPYNAAMLSEAGARAIIHSDSAVEIQSLNEEAAKAVTAGKKIGIEIDADETLRWITANAAWALGIEERTGTLEEGKMADIAVWDGNPFSVYSKVSMTFIDGILEYSLDAPSRLSDFELGQPALEGVK